jgi:hypothetical protein
MPSLNLRIITHNAEMAQQRHPHGKRNRPISKIATSQRYAKN